jgi:Transposase DDE domain
MNCKSDSPRGRELRSRRFATVAPAFGNRRSNQRLHRFPLRGRTQVDGQGKLYCLVHNLEKRAPLGYAR